MVRGDVAELLEFSDTVFDEIVLLVRASGEWNLIDPVGFRWNDWYTVPIFNRLLDPFSAIISVGERACPQGKS
jgi:hypothetical protein